MYRIFALMAMLAAAVFGQNTSIVQGQWPGETILMYRDGSNNLEYQCTALSTQPAYTWSGSSMITSLTDAANTATIVFASAHGLSNGNRIFILGMTSSGTTGLNNSTGYIVTVTNSTTVTITTSGVTDGAYTPSTDPAMKFWTTAPRTNANIWVITKFYWTTTYLDRQSNAEGDISPSKACDSRTTYAYN